MHGENLKLFEGVSFANVPILMKPGSMLEQTATNCTKIGYKSKRRI